jgi:hypothetical protein
MPHLNQVLRCLAATVDVIVRNFVTGYSTSIRPLKPTRGTQQRAPTYGVVGMIGKVKYTR